MTGHHQARLEVGYVRSRRIEHFPGHVGDSNFALHLLKSAVWVYIHFDLRAFNRAAAQLVDDNPIAQRLSGASTSSTLPAARSAASRTTGGTSLMSIITEFLSPVSATATPRMNASARPVTTKLRKLHI